MFITRTTNILSKQTESKSRNRITRTLSSNAHWQVNKYVAKQFGIESALLLADLISKEQYFREKNQLIDNKWFFNTQENIEDDTSLSPYIIRESLKKFKEYNVIDTCIKGLPAKRYFSIDYDKLDDFLSQSYTDSSVIKNLTTSCEMISQQVGQNFDSYINNNKDNKNKEEKTAKEKIFDNKAKASANLLVRLLEKRNPRTASVQSSIVKVTIKQWTKDFSELTERYSYDEIRSVMIWAFADDWWGPHVHDAKYLIKNFDKMLEKSKQSKRTPSNGKKPVNFLEASEEEMEAYRKKCDVEAV